MPYYWYLYPRIMNHEDEFGMTYEEYHSKLSDQERKNAPKELYYEGDFSLLTTGKKISVVGSRKVSKDGLRRTEIVTKKLVEMGVIVVSGLAAGVDTSAHETAIKHGGRTIAVLGTPIDKCYPASNRDLLNEIKANHLAISQFPKGQRVYPSNFPTRNKTMALISDATIIIEATENSGTRHQGWEALRLGRQVYILENVWANPYITWTKKMEQYGAEVLTRDNMENLIEEVPAINSSFDFAF